ncbi:MAG: hypothetical protein Q7N95_07675 [Alphaproteobacteria bacterium]|nr:hypothetical protein [Alphaproteobacteria bacterium]
MRLRLAILNILAQRPDGRASFDDLRGDIEAFTASEDHAEQLNRFVALGDVDLFKSGLVVRDEAGLTITGEGLLLLRSLESPGAPAVAAPAGPAPQTFRLIDDLIGTEERLRIFDLELRGIDSGIGDGTDEPVMVETPEESLTVGIDQPQPPESLEPVATAPPEHPSLPDDALPADVQAAAGRLGDAPAFLRRGFGSAHANSESKSSLLSRLVVFIASMQQTVVNLWRRHVGQAETKETAEHNAGGPGGAAFVFLTLVVLVACAIAVVALAQIRSLRSDLATFQRDLLPVKERLARLEQIEKTKLSLDQQEGGQIKSAALNKKAGGETRIDHLPLNLTREEIQFVRDYIKPSPSSGPALPAINIGDSVGGATIPLPSQLTEKVPKLIGARFATRNGSIIIVRRDSRQADAVLAPN